MLVNQLSKQMQQFEQYKHVYFVTDRLIIIITRAEEPGDKPRAGAVRRRGAVRHLPQLGPQGHPDIQARSSDHLTNITT